MSDLSEQIEQLLQGGRSMVAWNSGGAGESPEVLFPGSFNPLHQGHRDIAELAAEFTACRVTFELSVQNVDKPALDREEILRRIGQFEAAQAVCLTRAPTFVKKSSLFPGTTFVVGADTIVRLGDYRYHGHDEEQRDSTIRQLRDRGHQFLVFGRLLRGEFCELGDLRLPRLLREICSPVPEARFRRDLSSTELRGRR